MFKLDTQNKNVNDTNSQFALNNNQNLLHPFSGNNNNNKQKWQDSFLKSSNYSKSPYQQPESIQSQNGSFLQEESLHSASQESTFSFHQYREILNNLFQNSEHQQEWTRVPEIVKLIIKAMSLSINAIQNKVVQNREVINDQGLQIKQNKLSLQNMEKIMKKLNNKETTSKSGQFIVQNSFQQKKRSFLEKKQQAEENLLFQKGLDLIMIQEVKTITDAIISKRIVDVRSQIQDLQQKLQQKFAKQHQNLQAQIDALKTWIPQLQIKQKLQQQKFQQSIKQHFTMIDKQSAHLIKQLHDQKQAMCQLGHYLQNQFCKRQEINELLKDNYDSKTNKISQNYDSNNNNFIQINKQRIQQIVKYEIESFQIVRRKQFEEFKQKIMKNINTFATVNEVEKIVGIKVRKNSTIPQTQQLLLNRETQKDEETLELKKGKNFQTKKQASSKQKSPVTKKVKQTKMSKKSDKQIHSVKAYKNTGKQRKISQFSHDQTIYDSPIMVDQKSYKTKSTPHDQSELKFEKYQLIQQLEQILMKKMETKIKQVKQSTKQSIESEINTQLNKLQKKLIKRLETAEEQFCSVVEENWRTMSQNNLKIQKSQKQSMENLLKVVSILNVVARYSTIVKCIPNQCIKWQKQVFNSTGKGVVTLLTDKTVIYVGTAGVYEVHIVVYTLYDPKLSFAVQINGEQVGKRTQKIGVKMEQAQQNQESQIQDKKIKKNQKSSQAIYHPSRGVEFNSTLLIPAKSNLTIRLLTQLNGQALMQIKKL